MGCGKQVPITSLLSVYLFKKVSDKPVYKSPKGLRTIKNKQDIHLCLLPFSVTEIQSTNTFLWVPQAFTVTEIRTQDNILPQCLAGKVI